MNKKHIVHLLQQGYVTIHVQFSFTSSNNPRFYTYKAKHPIAVGDYVIVETGTNNPCKLFTAVVMKVDDFADIDTHSDIDYKWIVQKVDMTEYNKIKNQEKEFLDSLKVIEKIKVRNNVLNDFKKHLPEDSDERKLFDSALLKLENGESNV